MPLIVGVVKVFDPLNKGLPPDEAAYQSIVSPAPGEAESVKLLGPQPKSPEPDGAAGIAFTVAVTAVLVAEMQSTVVFLACA